MEKTALIGMQGINAYRRALGISPVAYNAKLVRAAFKHSEEMTKLGRVAGLLALAMTMAATARAQAALEVSVLDTSTRKPVAGAEPFC